MAAHASPPRFRFEIRDPDTRKESLFSLLDSGGGRRKPTSRRSAVPLAPLNPFASLTFGGAAQKRTKQRTKLVIHDGRITQHVVWDGNWRVEDDSEKAQSGSALRRYWDGLGCKVSGAFFPEKHEVTEDFWHWWKCRMSMMFATQSLLYALGIGATKSVAASAAVNWMLKEGLGKLARMGVATSCASNFDSDLKRVRFSSSLMFSVCIGAEFLTPYVPHLFVLLASISNVGKAIAAMAHTTTQPAVMRSFCRGENISDVTARCQAQNTVVDQVGIATAATLTWAVRNSRRWTLLLPLIMYPICFVGDITLIHRELKAVHLRTLNRRRAETLLSEYLSTRQVLTPSEVSAREPIVGRSEFDAGPLPLRIAPVTDLFTSPDAVTHELRLLSGRPFCVRLQPQNAVPDASAPPGPLNLLVALRQDASPQDVVAALTAACDARRRLLDLAGAEVAAPMHAAHACGAAVWWENGAVSPAARAQVAAAERNALRESRRAVRAFKAEGWLCDSVMLNHSERIRYSIV